MLSIVTIHASTLFQYVILSNSALSSLNSLFPFDMTKIRLSFDIYVN
uniref:Uncharacterized protein n=1 Tax=Herelleviridae sp. cttEB8 TaxID=2825832 RepID=A0A8S5P5F4_9CAUD|nr:MAG TPA: hypothetical protein [Herelleviridae sp. cttEB8]